MIVLCGTNRRDAVTRKVAQHIFKLCEAALKADSSLGNAGPILYRDLESLRPDLFEPASYGQKPTWFNEEFQKPILAAKGLLIVTPEYNGSFPGVLKYFIDMLKFPESLQHVPVCVVGIAAGQFAALRAVEQLEMILHYRKVHLFGERLFVSSVGDHVQADGSLGQHEERLQGVVSSFIKFAAALSCAK